MRNNDNIILLGVPRSGSSWLSEILTYKNEIRLVHEPDNELISFFGLYHKKGLHRFPYIDPKKSNPRVENLFGIPFKRKIYETGSIRNELIMKLYNYSKERLDTIFEEQGSASPKQLIGSDFLIRLLIGNQHHQRVLLKSVHGLLLLPYLKEKLSFTPVILQRHPLNVFSSYIKLNLPDGNRSLFRQKELLNTYGISSPKDISEKSFNYKCGYQLGVFRKITQSYKTDQKLSGTLFLEYEKIIKDPYQEIQILCKDLSIKYTSELESYMKSKFKAGEGFETNRVLTNQHQIWKKRLSKEQINEFIKGYEAANGQVDFTY